MLVEYQPNTILNWVATLPIDVTFVLLVLPVIIIAAVGSVATRLVFGSQISPSSSVGSSKAGAAAEIYAVVLGFIIVLGFTQFQDAKKDVIYEAELLERLAFSSAAIDDGVLPQQIGNYARSVVNDEWPYMAVGESSPDAEAQIQALERQVRLAAVPANPIAGFRLLTLMDEIVALRVSRLTASPDPLVANVIFYVLGVGTLLALVTGWFLRGPSIVVHVFLSAFLAGAVVLLMILSAQVLYPFAGPVAVSSEPFQALLDTIGNS